MNETAAVLDEYSGIALGDKRLDARALRMAEAMASRAGKSLPDVFENDSQLEAAYRFFRNGSFNYKDVLAPHMRETVARAARCSNQVIAAHDTTEMQFAGTIRRPGLGTLTNGNQGFLAHMTMLAQFDERCRDPLGIADITCFFRDKPKGKRRSGFDIARDPQSESKLWMKNVRATERKLAGSVKPIHVLDRGGDSYHLLADMEEEGFLCVVRSKYNRKIELEESGEIGLLHAAAAQERTVILTRSVTAGNRNPAELDSNRARAEKRARSKRTPSAKKANPARAERTTELHVTASQYTVLRPKTELAKYPQKISVNVVRVFEPNPPEDCDCIEWLLLTNLPTDTAEQVATVVDAYRTRWVIEEYFKCLKTGCSYEDLQLQSRQSLLNALAMKIPIAWQLLRVRSLARLAPEMPASDLLTSTQIEVLQSLKNKPLSARPTVREALLRIASMGGHLKHNGEPGWIVLWRGFHKLLLLEEGWLAARQKCDQS